MIFIEDINFTDKWFTKESSSSSNSSNSSSITIIIIIIIIIIRCSSHVLSSALWISCATTCAIDEHIWSQVFARTLMSLSAPPETKHCASGDTSIPSTEPDLLPSKSRIALPSNVSQYAICSREPRNLNWEGTLASTLLLLGGYTISSPPAHWSHCYQRIPRKILQGHNNNQRLVIPETEILEA